MEQLYDICEYLNKLQITMQCEFIPLSQSRNAKKEYHSRTDFSINWKVTIFKNDHIVVDKQDYMQGIGHLPAKLGQSSMTLFVYDRVQAACEKGLYNPQWKNSSWISLTKKIPEPTIPDVLWNLLVDAKVWDYDGFPDWCADFGYNDDLISAKKTYDDCMKIAISLHKHFSDDEIETLNQLFDNY